MAQAERELHAEVGLSRLPTRRPMVEQHIGKPEEARAVGDVERRLAQTCKPKVEVAVAPDAASLLGAVALQVAEPHHMPTRRVVDPAGAPSLLRGTAGGSRLIRERADT